MKRIRLLLFIGLVGTSFTLSCASPPKPVSATAPASTTHAHPNSSGVKTPSTISAGAGFLPHPEDAKKRIEYFLSQPEGDGPWPVVVLVHGHQDGERIGGRAFVEQGRLAQFAKRGWVTLAVSQPGYGNSDGPPDYCGPRTQQAIQAVIAFARGLSFVDPTRVALYGVSRGAIAAALVGAQDPALAALVLQVGVYDLGNAYTHLRKIEDKTPEVLGIADHIEQESGASFAELRARSALYQAEKIHAPTLIFAGAHDPRTSADEAREFARRIQAAGTPARALVFEEAGHKIPAEARDEVLLPFLEMHLRGNDQK